MGIMPVEKRYWNPPDGAAAAQSARQEPSPQQEPRARQRESGEQTPTANGNPLESSALARRATTCPEAAPAGTRTPEMAASLQEIPSGSARSASVKRTVPGRLPSRSPKIRALVPSGP